MSATTWSLFKGCVDMEVTIFKISFSSSSILRSKIWKSVLHMPYLIPLLNYKLISPKSRIITMSKY